MSKITKVFSYIFSLIQYMSRLHGIILKHMCKKRIKSHNLAKKHYLMESVLFNMSMNASV